MTPAEFAAIRARADAATKGPWYIDTALAGVYALRETTTEYGTSSDYPRITEECATLADADFIAEARTDIPALLAALDDTTRERDEAREGREVDRRILEGFRSKAEAERDALRAENERYRILNESLMEQHLASLGIRDAAVADLAEARRLIRLLWDYRGYPAARFDEVDIEIAAFLTQTDTPKEET